mmetsp:Transcript_17079/g.20564  ORF Transcript_17079/g.20564 Transcript_17079/m.20564 type:complete len:220 (-) Transcript_17079:3109-3768(-)
MTSTGYPAGHVDSSKEARRDGPFRFFWRTETLPVCVTLNPSILLLPHQVLTGLVIQEDEHAPWHTREPVERSQRTGTEDLVEWGNVQEHASKSSLEAKTEVHEAVLHTLFKERQLTGLGDQQVSPLHNNDGNEVGCLGICQGGLLEADIGVPLGATIPPVEGASGGRGNRCNTVTASETIVNSLSIRFVVGAVNCKLCVFLGRDQVLFLVSPSRDTCPP